MHSTFAPYFLLIFLHIIFMYIVNATNYARKLEQAGKKKVNDEIKSQVQECIAT